MSEVKALLATLRPAERTVPVCLRGDLLADLQAAQRDLEQAQRERSASLAGGGGVRDAAERVEAIQAGMREHTVTFRLRALGGRGKTFRDMVLAHPPRDGVEKDKLLGFNEESLFLALVRACLVAPVLDEEDWAALEGLNDGQWQQLCGAAWAVNAADVDIPFSRAASRALSESDAT